MSDVATPEEMKEYGGEWVFDEKGKVIGPPFGKDFVNADWNRPWAGKRVIRDSNDPGQNYQIDEWCYVNRLKGCVDFNERNNKKLQEYLVAKSAQTIARENPGNRRVGRGTRRVRKGTRRVRKTRRR